MNRREVLVLMLPLLLASCGRENNTERCINWCNVARTCSGITGWKTNSCKQLCEGFVTINTAADCDANFNAWLDCEDGYKSQICTKSGDPCENMPAYSQWQSCQINYCFKTVPTPVACIQIQK